MTGQRGHLPVFPDEEYAARLERMRQKMAEDRLDACVLSTPESICWLTGLNHWGNFALHVLIVPREGKMRLVARAMESVTFETQTGRLCDFHGYKDSESGAVFTANLIKMLGFGNGRIGIDLDTLYRSFAATRTIIDNLPGAEWSDSHFFMEELRYVKSPLEIAAMRQAASISERMMEAAIRTAAPGVNERAVAAEVYKEMVLAGGEPPSFGPFIRPKTRLGEEHGTWGSNTLTADDTLFVEISGSYQRYHAPMGRFVYLSPPTPQDDQVKALTMGAFAAVVGKLRPGNTADDVYQAWQKVVDDAGLSDYKRHHAGYMVGMSFPPTWMEGANRSPLGLRKGSRLELQAGMSFHVLSWLVGSRLGDYFVSNTVLVTDGGGEVLTATVGHNV